jgi:hypothetical protein
LPKLPHVGCLMPGTERRRVSIRLDLTGGTLRHTFRL